MERPLCGRNVIFTYYSHEFQAFKDDAGLGSQPLGFHRSGQSSIRVGIVMGRMYVGQIILSIFLFSPVTDASPMLHTHLLLNIALIRRTRGAKTRNFQP